MDFVRSHFGKMNLWPVEHFFEQICHHFWVGATGATANPPKKDDKYAQKKCSTGHRFIFPKWLLTKSILYVYKQSLTKSLMLFTFYGLFLMRSSHNKSSIEPKFDNWLSWIYSGLRALQIISIAIWGTQ